MPYGTLSVDTLTPSANVLSVTGSISTGSLNSSNTFGFKNRIINGQMQIAQRKTSATITAGSTIDAGYSTVDRFYVYCTGANVTAAQGIGTGNIKNTLQITGASSVTGIGIGQRIEALNSYDLVGQIVTLSADISNSLLTTVTWTAYYANTEDSFGTLASPTRTQIATGTWTVSSTLTNYNAQITIPLAATTGIEIVFTVGAQTSGTWIVGNVQLEAGSVATRFDYRPYGTELMLCQRYCYTTSGVSTNGSYNAFQSAGVWNSTTGAFYYGQFPVRLRSTPSFTTSAASIGSFGAFTISTNAYTPLTSLSINNVSTATFYLLAGTIGSAAGVSGATSFITDNNGSVQSNNWLIFSAEL